MGLLEGNPCFIDALEGQIQQHKDAIKWLKMIKKMAEKGENDG